MLGLDQQVGGQPRRVGRAVGDDQALGRAEQHHRGDAVALHLDLGARHRRRAGPDDLADPGDRLGAEAERGQAGRPVDPEHVGDAELAAHDEHRRVDRCRRRRGSAARRARPAARRRRPPARRAGRRRSGSWPCPTARTGRPRRSGSTFSPTCSPGSGSNVQSVARADQLLVERPAVGDGVVEGGVDGRRDRRPHRSRRASPAAGRARARCRRSGPGRRTRRRRRGRARPRSARRSTAAAAGSKMSARPRAHSAARAGSSIADHRIRRSTVSIARRRYPATAAQSPHPSVCG